MHLTLFFRLEVKTSFGTSANSSDPIQTPPNAPADQGLYCSLIAYIKCTKYIKTNTINRDPLKIEMDLSKRYVLPSQQVKNNKKINTI